MPTTPEDVRFAMVWRAWVEQWSRAHAVALKRGVVQSSMLPLGYTSPDGFSRLFTSNSASPSVHRGGLPSKSMPGTLPHRTTRRALDMLGVSSSKIPPAPFIPSFLVQPLNAAPPSPYSAVVTIGGMPAVSTMWAPLSPSFYSGGSGGFADFEVFPPPWTPEGPFTPWPPDKPYTPWPPEGPLTPWDPPGFPDPPPNHDISLNKGWEQICCAGLDLERRELSAIIQIKQDTGYSRDRCAPELKEFVGFWLIEPSIAEPVPQMWDSEPNPNPMGPGIRFIGTTSVEISDIPRNIVNGGRLPYQPGILHYAVHLKLNGSDLRWMRRCVETARLPRLHVVLAWNQLIDNANYEGRGVAFGDVFNGDVEFPLRKPVPCKQDAPGIKVVRINPNVTAAAPIHVAHLPDGNVLFFSGGQYGEHPKDHHSEDQRHYEDSFAIFRADIDTIENVGTPPFDTFCAGHSTLSDGNILILGGTEVGREHDHMGVNHWPGLDDVCVYDWKRKAFVRSTKMNDGRWYPSTVVLGTGEVFVMDGHPKLSTPVHTNYDLEIYARDGLTRSRLVVNANPSAGSSDDTVDRGTDLPPGPDGEKPPLYTFSELHTGLYPRVFLMPNGKVFSSSIMRSLATVASQGTKPNNASRQAVKIHEGGWGQTGNGRVLQDNCYLWDPNTPWEARRVFEGPPGSGSLYNFNESSVLLPIHVNHMTNDCDYEEVAVLSFVNEFASIIKPLSVQPRWTKYRGRRGTSSNFGIGLDEIYRVHGNIVLLPNRRVMFVGGVHTPYRREEYTELEIEEAFIGEIEYLDLSNPAKPMWLPPDRSVLNVPRRYHSTAILLPDGRVMVAGSDRMTPNDDNSPFQRDIEIVTPDYMQLDEKPVIDVDRESVGYGETLNVSFHDGWNLTKVDYFSLIRMYSVTHSFGYDQRMITMYPADGPLRTYDVNLRIPNNPSLLPPGYYMLFAISSKGVPSCARIIRIGA